MSPGRPPRLKHRLEYALFAGAVALGLRLSDTGADRLGAALGRLGYRLGIRRAVVERHLALAFPDRDQRWIRPTARACYEHVGREALAMLRLAGTTPETIRRRVSARGIDRLQAALAEGRGAVIVSGHLGNWEIGAAVLAVHGIPIDVVVQRQANPLFDRAIVNARERLGVRVIDRRHATQRALRSLREARAVAFVSDQNAGRSGAFVPFFGRPASTHRGAALLAIRTGAPLFLAYLRRAGAGYQGFVEPIEIDRSGDTHAAVERLTAAFTAALETAVRQAPEQYFWHHRRWKTRPPGE